MKYESNKHELPPHAQRLVELMEEYLAPAPAARELVYDVLDVIEWIDDLVDGDKDLTLEQYRELLHVTLVKLPSNQFYIQNLHHFTPAIARGIREWNRATDFEIAARKAKLDGTLHDQEGKPTAALERLRHSYVLRNTIFDVANVAVEIVSGIDAEEQFAGEWFDHSRLYEDFDAYVAKVTAENRPEKD